MAGGRHPSPEITATRPGTSMADDSRGSQTSTRLCVGLVDQFCGKRWYVAQTSLRKPAFVPLALYSISGSPKPLRL